MRVTHTIELPEPSHVVMFHCTFCGGTFSETLPQRCEAWPVDGCQRCTVSVTAKLGTKVVYGAAHHRGHGAMYADTILERGKTYTLARIKLWQHGAWIWLQETGTCSFNLRLFTPSWLVLPGKGMS